jgi:electron transport complex protein RnfG
MYRAMVGIGLVCAFIIVSVFQYTAPIIKQNKLELLQKALYQIFTEARNFQTYQLQPDGQFLQVNEDVEDQVIYAMYDAKNTLLGIVITAKGMGYQDIIEMIYGYLPDQQIIRGYKILASRETPGLGTKIETEKKFQDNFTALDATVNSSVSDLQNPIEAVKPGKKIHPWQIDTISGATVSSKAVVNMISSSASQWIPTVQKHLKDFEQ